MCYFSNDKRSLVNSSKRRKRLEKADSSGEKETTAAEIHELCVDLKLYLGYEYASSR